MNDFIEQITERLLAARHLPGAVFMYPHVSLDGDALCSILALAMVLRRVGVKVRIPLDEAVPDRLSFLPGLDLIEKYDETLLEAMAADQQLALAVDCSDSDRVGLRKALFDRAPEWALIDHHIPRNEPCSLCWIDPTAAAAGEMVFDVISRIEERLQQRLLDKESETLLMTAVISDTGGFVYSNTSARTFRTAAALMDGEVDLRQITYQLFDLTSQERMRLMGRIFTDVRFSHGGRLALAVVDQNLLSDYGASDADLEGVVAHIRNVAGVEVALLIREVSDNLLRVNIRSGNHFNAAEFAAQFGGGGHAKAAGLQLRDMTMEEAEKLIVDKAGEWL